MDNGTKEEKNRIWDYAVCFGTVITFIAGIGHVNSFGLIYRDFMIHTQSTTKSLTTANGVFAIMLAIGGIILNIITKKLTLRQCGLIGSCIFSTGSFLTILISNTNHLPFTFGVLQGIGFGILVPVCYSTLNLLFTTKRTTVMSIIKSLQGIILMWYPQVIKQTLSVYGFRGTLLIIFGISLHTFPGMLLMKTENKDTGKRLRTAKNIEIETDKQIKLELLNNDEQKQQILSDNGTEYKTSKKNRCQYLYYQRKFMRITNLTFHFLEVLNLRCLKDPVYCNICVGQSFMNFSDLTFFILQPMLLFQYGYDKAQVATCITIGTGADVAGRLALAMISGATHINTRLLYYVATLLTLVVRLVLLQIHEFIWVAAITAVLGILRAWIHIASPLVISNHVTHEDFAGAYALFMLAAGVVNLTCSPFIGMIKDSYEDYVPAFYALSASCLPCLIMWPIELVSRRK
ncbi:uncharacterized protein LOC101738091 isoform X2 [Bombyx mori]|uniref:Monocarboxylate transporter n=1 Tax=Bombyx mori TaxID=7091 RepID=A0A8R2C880_BOMMO|nr:uncharacterized protein LOC101738091 isoform X2 [Bombyx mori]